MLARFPRYHSRIVGVGAYRPSRVVTNAEVCGPIHSSDEWIRQRSGIRTRRFAGPGESLADMAGEAAGKALAAADVQAGEIDLVLVATMSNLRQAPPLAPDVAHRIGARRSGAVDLGAACAGFSYGLALASDVVQMGSAARVLLVGVERMSDIVDPTDRSTAFLFGDGAGAVVVGRADRPGIGPTVWGSDGAQLGAIAQHESWVDLREDPTAAWPALRMAGPEVFRWVVTHMAPVGYRAVAEAGITVADLTAFVPHQANLRITEALVKALHLPDGIAVARDVVDTGNTSAASIPLAMHRLLRAEEERQGGLALVLGFGSGMVYAGQVVRLP